MSALPAINENGHMEIDGKFYIPSYAVLWQDSETSSDPDVIAICSDFDQAQEECTFTKGDYWTASTEHYSTVKLMLQEVVYENWGGEESEGDWNESGKAFLAGEITNIEELLYVSHGTREGSANDLHSEVYFNLGNDLQKHMQDCRWSGRGKYSTLEVGGKSIKLRIADHSYNPKNNNFESGDFLSIVVANKNETKGKFSGRKELQFDGADSYDHILQSTIQYINENI